MACRGIRGATTCAANSDEAISAATLELLETILQKNQVATPDIASVQFTCSPDLTVAFPAKAARQLGFEAVPLLCTQEMAVDGALEKCVRVLLLVNTERAQKEIQHIYLHGARVLRPDLAGEA